MNLFETTGVLWIAPGGDKEHPEAWGDVIEWGALNVGAEAAADPNWIRQRQLMAGVGVAAFPWLHVRSMGDLDRLLDFADRWGTRYAGVNIEDVVSDNLSVPAIAATLQRWGGDALIITLPWIANGQGWQALEAYPFALEYFPFDPTWNPIFDPMDVLVDHACDEIGDEAKITFMYGTYPDAIANPSRYNLNVAHSFYPGDSIGTTVAEWDEWQHNGPTPFITCGGDMTPIGPQSGIKATYNRFKAMDPAGCNPAFNPDQPFALPVDQLKAYDKWCRTMTILVQDHDAGQA